MDPAVYHSDFGTTQYIQAYGVDYLQITDLDRFDPHLIKLTFDGDDNVHTGWQYIENQEIMPIDSPYWWSSDGDQIDNLMTLELNLSTPTDNRKHILEITTAWDIEENWDYGFVQVSTDDGLTWTTLDDIGDYCTDEAVNSAMETITANLPGLTGNSEGWKDLSFDLSAYDGQEILVGFRYMTDWGYSLDGWMISEVSADGEDVPLQDLTATTPAEADFLITIFAYDDDLGVLIIDVPVLDGPETATKLAGTLVGYETIIVVISPINGPVDYSIDVTYRGSMMPR